MSLLTRDVTKELRLQQALSTTAQTTVFRAIDPQSHTAVALKLISPFEGTISEAGRQRFVTTMEVLRSLRSQSCPDLLEVGFTPDGSAYMLMELMSGAGLETYAGLPPARTIPLLVRLIGALEVLAAEQVFHYNLKPENVLVTKGKDQELIRLLGFGTAALLAREEGRAVAGRSREDEPFSAPELYDPGSGDPREGWRSDLYSFALVACQVLGAEISGLGTETPEVILAPRPGLGDAGQLTGALALALQLDPAHRELPYGELRKVLGNAMPPAPPGRYERTGRIDLHSELSAVSDEPAPFLPTIRLQPSDLPGAATDEVETLDIDEPDEPVLVDAPDVAAPADTGWFTDSAENEEDYSAVETMADEALPLQPIPPTVRLTPTDAGWFTDSAENEEDYSAVETMADEALPVQPIPPTVRLTPADAGSSRDSAEDEEDYSAVETLADEALPVQPIPPTVHLTPATLATPPTEAAQAPEAETGEETGRRRIRMTIVVGVVLLLVAVIATILILRQPEADEEALPPQTGVAETATPTPATPTPEIPAPGTSTAAHQLENARTLLAEGDTIGAKLALELIDPAKQQLTSEEQTLLGTLGAEITASETKRAVTTLRAALSRSSPVKIRQALAAFSQMDEETTAAIPGLAADLARAREVLQVEQQLRSASRKGEHSRVLELATRLIALLPKYSQAYNLREDAAAELERRARAAQQAGDDEAAQAHLEPIRRYWPDRLGTMHPAAG